MNAPPSRPMTLSTLAQELAIRAAGTPGQMPIDGVARTAAATWTASAGAGAGPTAGTPQAQRRRAAVAVVNAVYSTALSAGRRAGAEAVATHIVTATRAALHRLDDHVDPDRIVRGLLERLIAAGQEESLRARRPGPGGVADTPLPRTYLAACALRGHRDDVDRAAHAAATAWRHGYRDGWGEAYWSTNRIINAVRHDELAGTTALAGTPTLSWLDRLADSAHRIATTEPDQHPARLASLAIPTGPTTSRMRPQEQGGPSQQHRGTARPGGPTHQDHREQDHREQGPTDNGPGRRRGA